MRPVWAISYGDGKPAAQWPRHWVQTKAEAIRQAAGVGDGDAVFFACAPADEAASLAGRARVKIGYDQDLIDQNAFRFAWIVDFPMFEADPITGKIDFSHNPFSMPQGE